MPVTKRQVIVSGAMTSWKGKPTPHAQLKRALERVNLADRCPPPISIGDACKGALASWKAFDRDAKGRKGRIGDKIIQRHASALKHGYELVDVDRADDAASANSYTTKVCCSVVTNGSGYEEIVVTRGDADQTFLQNEYMAARRMVSASGMSRFLLTVLKELNGTDMEEWQDGVYYLPEGNHALWTEKLIPAIESIGTMHIGYCGFEITDNTVRALKAGIEKEIRDAAEKIEQQLASGELGVRGMENRIGESCALLQKAKDYEQIIGQELTQIRAMLSRIEQSAVNAIAKKQSEEQYSDLLTI